MNNQPFEEQITHALHNVPEPNPAHERAARTAFLAEARRLREHPSPVWQRPHSRTWMIVAAALLIFLIGGFALSVQNLRQSNSDATVQAEIISPDNNPSLHQDITPTPSQGQISVPITAENAAQLVELQRFGAGTVNGAVWSPDGKQLALYGSLGIWFYDTSDFEATPRFVETNSYINDAAYSPDGASLVLANADGTIHVVDIVTGQVTLNIEAYEKTATQVLFTHDGSEIISGGSDWDGASARFWSATMGRERLAFGYSFDETTTRLALAPSNLRIAIAGLTYLDSSDYTDSNIGYGVTVLDIVNDTDLYTLDGPTSSITAVAYSPDGNLLAASSHDGLYLWEGRNLKFQLTRVATPVEDTAFSPDGQVLASAQLGGLVHLWNTTTGENIGTLFSRLENHNSSFLQKVIFSPDGQSLLALDKVHGLVMIWDWQSETVKATLDDFSGGFNALSLASDDSRIAVGSENGKIYAWDRTVESPQTLQQQYGQDGVLTNVAFVPNTHLVAATGSRINNSQPVLAPVTLWDADNGLQELAPPAFERTDISWIWDLDFNTDGSQAVFMDTGSSNFVLTLWDVQSWQKINRLEAYQPNALVLDAQVAFSPANNLVAFTNYERSVRLWDLESTTERQLLPSLPDIIAGIAFSPDGKFLVALDGEGTVQVWDTVTWQESMYIAKTGGSCAITFSANSKLIAVAGDDRIYLWDIQNQTLITQLTGHTSDITQIQFSHDGTVLVTASYDGTVRVWGLQ
ncbi:MAG: WD40 repeat domain-containing protein [Chloroflexi bacterium]|nr:WD40 repeat domain-containing protein [Chloroflexota bacterium]